MPKKISPHTVKLKSNERLDNSDPEFIRIFMLGKNAGIREIKDRIRTFAYEIGLIEEGPQYED